MSLSAKNQTFVERLTEAQADLFGFVASMLPFCPDDVNDVAQQTNLALIKHADDYDLFKPFKPWMFQFAKSEISHYLRAKGRCRVTFDEETVEKSAEYLADDREGMAGEEKSTYKRLAYCKSKLSEEQRRMIDLRYTHSCGVEEIAKQMHQKVQSVYNALAYVRRKLADCLRRMCRLGDAELEHMPAHEVDSLCEELIDKARSPLLSDTQRQHAFIETITRDEANLHRYLDEMTVHELLSGRLAKKKQENISAAPAISSSRWSRAALLAAGFAVLFTAGVSLITHRASRLPQPEDVKPVPLAVETVESGMQEQIVAHEEAKPVASEPVPQKSPGTFFVAHEKSEMSAPAIVSERTWADAEVQTKAEAAQPRSLAKENMKNENIARIVAVATAAVALSGRALADGAYESAPITIQGSPNSTLFWRTYNTVVSSGVTLDWPTNATYAELTYAGMGKPFKEKITDTSLASYSLTLPVKDQNERVYGLTLVYYAADDSAIKTLSATNIAVVRGVNGATGSLIPLGMKDKTWTTVKSTIDTVVLPVAPDTTSLTLNGTTVSTGFGKYPGWYGWYPIKTREHQLVDTTSSETFSATLRHASRGTVIYLQ